MDARRAGTPSMNIPTRRREGPSLITLRTPSAPMKSPVSFRSFADGPVRHFAYVNSPGEHTN